MEIYQGIETPVNVGDGEKILTIRCYEANVIEFWLDGVKIFSGDWSNNFKDVFAEAKDAYEA